MRVFSTVGFVDIFDVFRCDLNKLPMYCGPPDDCDSDIGSVRDDVAVTNELDWVTLSPPN